MSELQHIQAWLRQPATFAVVTEHHHHRHDGTDLAAALPTEGTTATTTDDEVLHCHRRYHTLVSRATTDRQQLL